MKISGTYLVQKGAIKVITNNDVCKYYRWLFNKAHFNTIKNQIPKHGAHVGIINPKIHRSIDCMELKDLNGKRVDFDIDIEGNYGGFTKGFLNFWLDAHCQEFIDIRKWFGVYEEQDGFAPFHLTILNTKNV